MLFANKLINKFNHDLFDTLLYKHNLTTHTPKFIEFNESSKEVMSGDGDKGFFMIKDNSKYLLPKEDCNKIQNISKLPIRVHTTKELVTKTNDVIKYICDDFKSFKIVPKQIYDLNTLLQLDGIIHENMSIWTLIKIITVTAYCRRINIIMSGSRHLGKTSYPSSLGQVTNKGYIVDKPGSNAGISKGITEDGYLALDEIGGLNSEQKRALDSFLSQAGGGNNYWRTGKAEAKSVNLLSKYDINNLSIMILCNLYEDYIYDGHTINIKDRDKFIHYMLPNQQAINRRFMPLRINDTKYPLNETDRLKELMNLPSEQFKDSSNLKLTKERKEAYFGMIKSLEWYKGHWDELVDYEYIDRSISKHEINNSHLLTYREILSGIYIYCQNKVQTNSLDHKSSQIDLDKYKYFKDMLLQWNNNYYSALTYYNNLSDDVFPITTEEEVIGK